MEMDETNRRHRERFLGRTKNPFDIERSGVFNGIFNIFVYVPPVIFDP